jgi:predicted dehydrogenase
MKPTRGRRRFLAGAAGTAAATIVPRHVLGGAGFTAPSDRLTVAGVGVGGMGANDIQNYRGEAVVALCDVDFAYAKKAVEAFPQARRYRDYREMLAAEKDLDAVTIATPDHTHAVIASAALAAGKHVYCQKPLAHDVFETRALAAQAAKAGLVTQMGIQGHSDEGLRLICEWIGDGAIGEVRKVEAWCTLTYYPPGHESWSTPCTGRPSDTPPVPEGLDWDLWIGPAAMRPYSPCYHPTVWRNWLAFGSGMLADRGCHTLDPVFTALELGYPSSVEASVTDTSPEHFPVASIVRYRFPARGARPPVELTWYDGLKPPSPEELEPGRRLGSAEGGSLFVGSSGLLMAGVYGEGPRLVPESRMQSYRRPPKTLPRVKSHYDDFITACKGRQAAAGAPFAYSALLTEVILLGNIAKRFPDTRLDWDPVAMRFRGHEEASRLVRTPYRDGWSLAGADVEPPLSSSTPSARR